MTHRNLAHSKLTGPSEGLRSDGPREFTARDDCEAQITFTATSLAQARREVEDWVLECDWDTSEGLFVVHVWISGEDGSEDEMDVFIAPPASPEEILNSNQLDAEIAKVVQALPALRAAAGGRPLAQLTRTELLRLIATCVD